MSDKIFCVKLQREGEKLDRPPFANDLGQRIFDHVSKEGWQAWLGHSTMLINEFRMEIDQPRWRDYLLKQCEEFFFGEGSELPPDFRPEASGNQGEAPQGSDEEK